METARTPPSMRSDTTWMQSWATAHGPRHHSFFQGQPANRENTEDNDQQAASRDSSSDQTEAFSPLGNKDGGVGSVLTGPTRNPKKPRPGRIRPVNHVITPVLAGREDPLANRSDTRQAKQIPYPPFPPASIENLQGQGEAWAGLRSGPHVVGRCPSVQREPAH